MPSELHLPSLSDWPNHVFTRPSLIHLDRHLCGFFLSQQRWPCSFPCRRRSPPQAVTVPNQSRMNSECACSLFSPAPSTHLKSRATGLKYSYFCAACVVDWLANNAGPACRVLGRACSGQTVRAYASHPSDPPSICTCRCLTSPGTCSDLHVKVIPPLAWDT